MRLTNLLFTTLLLFVSVFARSQKSNEFTVLQWNVWQEGTMVPGGYDAIVNEIVRLKPGLCNFPVKSGITIRRISQPVSVLR